MSLVAGIKLKTGTTVHIKTTPGDNVVTYRGFLLKQDSPSDPKIVQQWTPSQLEAGVAFVFDAVKAKKELYTFAVGIQSSAAEQFKTDFTYTPPPPPPKSYDRKVPKSASSLEWVFVPL